MTITKKVSVPVTSATISFFWKMKQLVVIDQSVTADHRVKKTYVIRKNNGTANKIALWITSPTGSPRLLNVGVSDEIPTDHASREFDFTDDACGIWLDKPTGAAEHVVIGTGDIRNIGTNPAGEVVKINLAVAEASAVIVTCSDDFLLTFYATSIPSPVTVPSDTVENP